MDQHENEALESFLNSVWILETFSGSFAYQSYINTFKFFNTIVLTLKQMEKISKALGDANRLKILQYISKKGGKGLCSEIQDLVDLTQPSISHHIKILIEAELIEPEKDGRMHKYTLNDHLIKEYTATIGLQFKGS